MCDSLWCCLLQEMIQLDDIPNLASLVSSFDQQQLANFCRILAVTISELDTGSDDKHTLLAKNAQQKKNLGPSRAEINQGNCYIVNKRRRISTVLVVLNCNKIIFLFQLRFWIFQASLSDCANWQHGRCLKQQVLPASSRSWKNGTPGWTMH